MELKTQKGSVIKRSKHGVGKMMGNNLYVHSDYFNIVTKDDLTILFACSILLPEDFNYKCVVLNEKEGWIRFDEAPDFDTAREPHAGLTYKVWFSGNRVESREVNQIWHHKWLWVQDDYTGFDVKESFEWSKLWLSKLNDRAKSHPVDWIHQLRWAGLK